MIGGTGQVIIIVPTLKPAGNITFNYYSPILYMSHQAAAVRNKTLVNVEQFYVNHCKWN